MKTAVKTTATVSTERPRALDTLTNIINEAVAYRFPDRTPSVSEVARLAATASRLMRFSNIDERIEYENRCVLEFTQRKATVS
jgi:hypothetical protein